MRRGQKIRNQQSMGLEARLLEPVGVSPCRPHPKLITSRHLPPWLEGAAWLPALASTHRCREGIQQGALHRRDTVMSCVFKSLSVWGGRGGEAWSPQAG